MSPAEFVNDKLDFRTRQQFVTLVHFCSKISTEKLVRSVSNKSYHPFQQKQPDLFWSSTFLNRVGTAYLGQNFGRRYWTQIDCFFLSKGHFCEVLIDCNLTILVSCIDKVNCLGQNANFRKFGVFLGTEAKVWTLFTIFDQEYVRLAKKFHGYSSRGNHLNVIPTELWFHN